jgi:hypothetical protein
MSGLYAFDPASWKAEAESLLDLAESRYGARDTGYQFLGVRPHKDGPQIRFTPDYKGIWIEISQGALPNEDQTRYQVAHEIVHLLAPVRCPPARMLEEGIAVHFSIYGPSYRTPEYRQAAIADIDQNPNTINYRMALRLFEELCALNPDAVFLLRQQQANLDAVSPELIRRIIPEASQDLASKLCERRQMR